MVRGEGGKINLVVSGRKGDRKSWWSEGGRGKENPGGQREEGGILVDSSSALHLLARYF